MPEFGFVVIGRNEGHRFLRCLKSLVHCGSPIVYVDSGSTDGSPEAAFDAGADVINLNVSMGFNMSRARNAGWRRLLEIHPSLEFVQFLDGDCELDPEWASCALEFLGNNPEVAVVCGRRLERRPEQTIYNRLIDIEWNTPVGPARSCGGDSMMRIHVLRTAGGFDEHLIAGEEPELCFRIRKAGWGIQRIAGRMSVHDADIRQFGQWWMRHVRAGYGTLFVASRQLADGSDDQGEILFLDQVRSPRRWIFGSLILFITVAVILSIALGSFRGVLLAAGIVFLAWAIQSLRIGILQRKRAGSLCAGLLYGISLMIAKWAILQGQIRFFRDQIKKQNARIIEYKK